MDIPVTVHRSALSDLGSTNGRLGSGKRNAGINE